MSREWLSPLELEAEALEHEFGARFDDVHERFAGEFLPCPICGVGTIDPFEHCPLPPEGEIAAEVNSDRPTAAEAEAERRAAADTRAPWADPDDIPF
jgi:hypothetical protein